MLSLDAPACEPVAVPPLSGIHVEHVARVTADGAVTRFAHFHDASELVLFDTVYGTLLAEQGECRLGAGSLVFVPSMAPHEFVLPAGDHAWTLVHVAPWLVDTASGGRNPDAPICTTLNPVALKRARVLVEWLKGATTAEETLAILTLLLSLVRADGRTAEPPPHCPTAIRGSAQLAPRLRVVLDRLHSRPGDPLTSAEAASLASLSPAYFSRAFRSVMGQRFSDYVIFYRLQVAAHLLLTTPLPVASIAFRTGFTSPSHFTARFHRRFALTPKQYRATRDDRSQNSG